MWTETFDEKQKQGMVKLSSKTAYYYCNEREETVTDEDGSERKQYVYDVHEVPPTATLDEIKSSLIAEEYSLAYEISLIRKTVAKMLNGNARSADNNIEDEFTKYNDRVEEIVNQVDAIGKVVQTETGNGTWQDPYKTWKVGKPVIEGKWYLTPINGYLWEAIKSGYPTSETDREYFDVVGL